jgi:hypothetical protein
MSSLFFPPFGAAFGSAALAADMRAPSVGQRAAQPFLAVPANVHIEPHS